METQTLDRKRTKAVRHVQKGYLSSSLSMMCRDLERRELWDISVMQSFTRVVQKSWQSGQTPRRVLMKRVSRKLKEGVNCGKHLLAGALSAAVCKTVVAPVERVRMDIVLDNTSHGPLGACVEIMRTEGFLGFWKGNLLNIIRTAPFKAVNFYAFDMFNKTLLGLTHREETGDWERFTAGALAGVTALLTCLPLDTVRTRLLSIRSQYQYNGMVHAFTEIVRTEGFTALYKGCIPGIMSIAPGSAVFYGVYGMLKQAHINHERSEKGELYQGPGGLELPVLHSLFYGAIAGMAAEAVVYPLEVIRRQVQLQMSSGTIQLTNGAVMQSSLQSFSSACNTIVRTQGPGGFYAGCLLNTVQVLPSAALSYFAYEAFKAFLQVKETQGMDDDVD